jgi:hypothetical protein
MATMEFVRKAIPNGHGMYRLMWLGIVDMWERGEPPSRPSTQYRYACGDARYAEGVPKARTAVRQSATNQRVRRNISMSRLEAGASDPASCTELA